MLINAPADVEPFAGPARRYFQRKIMVMNSTSQNTELVATLVAEHFTNTKAIVSMSTPMEQGAVMTITLRAHSITTFS